MSASACTESWRRRVSAYHDGHLAAHERQMVEAHLHTCASCRATLASYDDLFRKLRTLPGFDGILSVRRAPAGQRGKPAITWNQRVPVSGHRERRNGWNGGIAAFLLVVIVTIAIVTSKGVAEVSPSSSLPPLKLSAAPTIAPTFGPQTSNGVACANAGNNLTQPYAYLDAASTVWKVSGCGRPVKLTTIQPGTAHLGAWSPDGKWLLVFGDTPSGNGATVAIMNTTTGALKQLSVNGIDQALWLDSATLIVRAQTQVRKITITTNASTVLKSDGVTKIALYNHMLFYSTTTATVDWQDLTTGTTTTIFTLDNADVPWDVSPDGNYVAFARADGATATVAYRQVGSTTTTTLFTLPPQATVQSLQYSPDGYHIAVILTRGDPKSPNLAIATFTNDTPMLYTTSGTCAWRADGLAIVAEPTAATATKPQLIDITSGAQTALPAQTAAYVWQPES